MNCIISYLNFILFRIQRERKFADKQLKADKEVVLEAIKNDIDSLKFADKKIIKWFESLSLWSRDQLLGLNKDKDPFGD